MDLAGKKMAYLEKKMMSADVKENIHAFIVTGFYNIYLCICSSKNIHNSVKQNLFFHKLVCNKYVETY